MVVSFVCYIFASSNKQYTMETYKLTKADWNKLNKLGLVDDGIGNGFANTTDKFDDNITCNSVAPTYVYVEGGKFTFMVQYVSGCFYPVWHKTFTDKVNFVVNKKGEITRK